VRVKCVADLARWKLVMVGATVYREEKQRSSQYAYLYFTAGHYILSSLTSAFSLTGVL